MKKIFFLLLPILLILSAGTVARAEYGRGGNPFHVNGMYVIPGVNINRHVPEGEDMSSPGNTYGIELSMSRFDEVIFYGMYLDAVFEERESGSGRDYRFTFGPEIGTMLAPLEFPVGIDCGYLLMREAGEYFHGAAARFYLPLIFVFPYVRYGWVCQHDDFVEYGVIIKFPIKL